MTEYRGGRGWFRSVFPDNRTTMENHYKLYLANDGKSLTFNQGDSYVFVYYATDPYDVPLVDIAGAAVRFAMSGIATFKVTYGWKGSAEGVGVVGSSNDWYASMPPDRAMTYLTNMKVNSADAIRNQWANVPYSLKDTFHTRMEDESLMIRLTCLSGSAQLDETDYQEDSETGYWLNLPQWEENWRESGIVRHSIGVKSDNTVIYASDLETINYGEPFSIGRWFEILSKAETYPNNASVGYFDGGVNPNFHDHERYSTPNVGVSAYWNASSSYATGIVSETEWSAYVQMPIININDEYVRKFPEWNGQYFGLPGNTYGWPWTDTSQIENATGSVCYENKPTETLYETAVAHPLQEGVDIGPQYFYGQGVGAEGSFYEINHLAADNVNLEPDIVDPIILVRYSGTYPNDPYSTQTASGNQDTSWPGDVGFKHSDFGERVADIRATDFPLTTWKTRTYPASTIPFTKPNGEIVDIVKPEFTMGAAFITAAFDLDMSKTPPINTDHAGPSKMFDYSDWVQETWSGTRTGNVGIHRVEVDVKYPRWKAQILVWVKQPSPESSMILPPLRQRQRDDGLTTDTPQQKGQGSSLQSSQRRGGRIYY